jgi:hypothetical protein
MYVEVCQNPRLMNLKNLVEQYEKKLTTWQNSPVLSTKIVLDVLVARYIIQLYLQNNLPQVSLDLLVKITELDYLLQQQERSLATQEIDLDKLKSYIADNKSNI